MILRAITYNDPLDPFHLPTKVRSDATTYRHGMDGRIGPHGSQDLDKLALTDVLAGVSSLKTPTTPEKHMNINCNLM